MFLDKYTDIGNINVNEIKTVWLVAQQKINQQHF